MDTAATSRRGSWTAIVGAIAVLSTAACADRAASPYETLGPDGDRTTVLVENTGIDPIAVYTEEDPARLATVMPGRSQCVDLRLVVEDAQRLIADPVGGGQSTVSPRFPVRPGEGWAWTVGTSAVDGLSLVPKAQCDSST